MNRDFIPKDQLSEFDYLFDSAMAPHKWYTGKIMALDPNLNYLLYCQNLPGADETDPETWIPAAPATDNQSSVKYRIGQTVNVKFPEGNFDFGLILGLNRNYTDQLNTLPTTDGIHEDSAAQSITYNRLTKEYTIKSGASTVKIGLAAVTIISTAGTITIPTTNLTGILNITGTLIVNGVDILTTLLSTASALAALNTLYLAHTHAVTTAPGVTGPPI